MNKAQKQILNNILWGMLIASVIVLPRVVDLNVFYGRDELTIWRWSDQFTRAVWAGDAAATLTPSNYPGIPMFWAQTLFLTIKYRFPSLFAQTYVPLAELDSQQQLDLLAERRLAAALLVSAQMIGAVWLTYLLFGGRVAFLSAILMGLDPFTLAESRLFRLQVTSVMFVCLSILAYFLYLRRRRWQWVLLSGLMAGLGGSSQTSAGLIGPYICLLLGLDVVIGGDTPWFSRLKRLVINGLIWAGGAMVAFWLVWPAMWVKPVAAIQQIFLLGLRQATEESVWHGKVFFWGQVVESDPGIYFYPVVLAFRTTPLIWLGIISALFFAGRVLWQKKRGRLFKKEETFWSLPWTTVAIILLLAYVIMTTVALSLVLSKVDRFLLLIFPPLSIISALGLAALIEWFGEWFDAHAGLFKVINPRQAAAGLERPRRGLVIVVLGLQLALTLPAHPYFYSYWNPLVGGGRTAVATLPVGSGEGLDQIVSYLHRQPDGDRARLICGGSKPWCSNLFAGTTYSNDVYADGDWVKADYASFYISQLQREEYPSEIVDFFRRQPPLYQVDLQGATYAWLYAVPHMDYLAGARNDLAGLGRLLGYNLSSPPAPPSGGDRGGAVVPVGQSMEATVWWVNLGAGVDNLVLRWIDETGYEWGRSNLTPLPTYASLPAEEMAVIVSTATLTVPLATPPGLYFLRMGALNSTHDQLLGEFQLPQEGDKFTVTPGQISNDPQQLAIPRLINQSITPEVTLLGYEPPEQVLTAGVPTWLALYWQASAAAKSSQGGTSPKGESPAKRPIRVGDVSPNYLPVIRLLDVAGREVMRWDWNPLAAAKSPQGEGGKPSKGWRYLLDNWQAGQIVKDVWPLQVRPDTPIGWYTLEVALFDADQAELKNRVTLEAIEVWPNPIRYDPPPMQADLQTNFNHQLTLLGYDLFFDDGGNRDTLLPHLHWQSQVDMQAAFDVLLTLRDPATNEAIKYWRVPLGLNGPKEFWKRGEVITTIYGFEVENITGKHYHLDIALQNQANDQPEPIQLADGTTTRFITIENIQDKMVTRIVP